MQREIMFDAGESICQRLTCRTTIGVVCGVEDEIILRETPRRLRFRRIGLRHVRHGADGFAGKDLLAVKVTAICEDVDLIDPHCVLGHLRHL